MPTSNSANSTYHGLTASLHRVVDAFNRLNRTNIAQLSPRLGTGMFELRA